MKLKRPRYRSAPFATLFMYKSGVAGFAIAILVAICCGTNTSAEEAGGQALSPERIRSITSAIDGEAIIANAKTTKDWLSYGLDYSETRFSKLNEINAGNVKNLGLKWTYNLESVRGVEATPLIVDGIMYVSASWSVVHAIDVRTGKRIWTYDPEVPRTGGYKGCCDVVNRGVALYKGKIFVGSYDGRLVAIDAVTGKKVWEKDTIIDHSHSYTVTGAPRVVKGKVLIGNGGAEFGVRGYISGYDAETGKFAWRFSSVPRESAKPFEAPILEKAVKTWTGTWWKLGGGGTVWESMAYDPDLDLLYFGTGNGTFWDQSARSPNGGDNLFTSSVVVINPTPADSAW